MVKWDHGHLIFAFDLRTETVKTGYYIRYQIVENKHFWIDKNFRVHGKDLAAQDLLTHFAFTTFCSKFMSFTENLSLLPV